MKVLVISQNDSWTVLSAILTCSATRMVIKVMVIRLRYGEFGVALVVVATSFQVREVRCLLGSYGETGEGECDGLQGDSTDAERSGRATADIGNNGRRGDYGGFVGDRAE